MCVLFGSSRAPLCLALFANLIVSEHIYWAFSLKYFKIALNLSKITEHYLYYFNRLTETFFSNDHFNVFCRWSFLTDLLRNYLFVWALNLLNKRKYNFIALKCLFTAFNFVVRLINKINEDNLLPRSNDCYVSIIRFIHQRPHKHKHQYQH